MGLVRLQWLLRRRANVYAQFASVDIGVCFKITGGNLSTRVVQKNVAHQIWLHLIDVKLHATVV